MIARLTAWSNALMRRRRAFLAAVALLVAVCGAWFPQRAAREDIRVLTPDGDSRLADQFAAMEEAPFMRLLSITVGGPGHDPRAAATSIAKTFVLFMSYPPVFRLHL